MAALSTDIYSFLHYLLRRQKRNASDADAVAAHAWHDGGELPGGLELEWLGTLGFRIGL